MKGNVYCYIWNRHSLKMNFFFSAFLCNILIRYTKIVSYYAVSSLNPVVTVFMKTPKPVRIEMSRND